MATEKSETAHAKMKAIAESIALADSWFSEIAKRCGVTPAAVMAIARGELIALCHECIGSGAEEGRGAGSCKACKGRGF